MILAAGGPNYFPLMLINLLPPLLFILALIGIVVGIYLLILWIHVLRLSIRALKKYLQS